MVAVGHEAGGGLRRWSATAAARPARGSDRRAGPRRANRPAPSAATMIEPLWMPTKRSISTVAPPTPPSGPVTVPVTDDVPPRTGIGTGFTLPVTGSDRGAAGVGDHEAGRRRERRDLDRSGGGRGGLDRGGRTDQRPRRGVGAGRQRPGPARASRPRAPGDGTRRERREGRVRGSGLVGCGCIETSGGRSPVVGLRLRRQWKTMPPPAPRSGVRLICALARKLACGRASPIWRGSVVLLRSAPHAWALAAFRWRLRPSGGCRPCVRTWCSAERRGWRVVAAGHRSVAFARWRRGW